MLHPKQFARYFHGSPGGISGDVVLPAVQGRGRSMNELAFATSRVRDAMGHASTKAAEEGRLFGSVYEVNPRKPQRSPLGDPKHVASAEGLDVVKHTGFVSSEEARWL
jgi:hypothetical protein